MKLRKKILPTINYYIEEYKELNDKGKIVIKTRNLILSKTRSDGSILLREESIDYDLRIYPIDYLQSLFLVSWEIDKLQLAKNLKPGKFFNVIPLMKDNIYGCVRFDTSLLKNLSSHRNSDIWQAFFKDIQKKSWFQISQTDYH